MTATNTLGAAVAPDFESINKMTAALPGSRWCCWKYEDRGPGKKPAKAPYSKLRRLDTTKPQNWLAYSDVRPIFEGGNFDGVGLLVTSNDNGIVAFDLDGCLNEAGEVVAEHEAVAAVAALVAMGSYVEVSPSGRGLHGFVMGSKPEGCREKVGAVEVYDAATRGRYLTVTGVPWGGPARPIVQNQAAVDDFVVRFGFLDNDDANGDEGEDDGDGDLDDDDFDGEIWPDVDDDEVLLFLKRNNKRGRITKLLKGDTTGYAGDSEARAAFIGHLAYYTRDADQIDRILRGSGLMKPKLDEKRGREVFSVWEIRRVLTEMDDSRSYWSDQAARKAAGAIERSAAKGLAEKAREFLVGGLDGLTNAKGNIAANLHAWSELLARDRRLIGGTWFDEFRMDAVKTASFSAVTGVACVEGLLTDDDFRAVVVWLAREWGAVVRMQDAMHAVLIWAGKTRRNPMTERLNRLAGEWDGVGRLRRWLFDYCGADGGKDDGVARYIEAVGERFFVGAVARAYQPGCKLDTMLTLEGPQGRRKSSAVRALAEAISPDAFLEGFSLDGLNKDTLLSLRGRLLVEWGELAGLSRHDAEVLKNFLSRQGDSYRTPYGVAVKEWPRTCAFVATTNDSNYLRDVTGNRRFWPVRVGRIDLERLRADAGLLWGEAVCLYRQGRRWWFDEAGDDAAVAAVAAQETAARMVPDAWVELVDDFGRKLAAGAVIHRGAAAGAAAKASDSFRMADLLPLVLGVETAGQRSASDESRLRAALRRAGWELFTSGGYGRWRLTDQRRAELLAEAFG